MFIVIMWILVILFTVLFLVKNEVTFRNQIKISKAIYNHNMDCIEDGDYDNMVSYAEIEEYNKTLLRLNDWGCTRIVSEVTFEKIKPYIE